MNVLVEIAIPYNYSSGLMLGGVIRLCDAKSSLTVNGNTYYPYLTAVGEITQSANLLSGGALCDFEDLAVTMPEDNILASVEGAGYTFNNATILVSVYEGSKKDIWFGYVKSTSLAINKLTFNCENLSKALKVLSVPVMYGDQTDIKLEVDESITLNSFSFPMNADQSIILKHPRIVEVGSPSLTAASNSYGVTYVNTTGSNYYIKIQYYGNDVFSSAVDSSGIPLTPLKVFFLSGENKGSKLRISKIVSSTASGLTSSTITLRDDFTNTKIQAVDRISIQEHCFYFKIDSRVSEVSKVKVKVNDELYTLNAGTWDIVTIAGCAYIRVFPSDNVYKRLLLSKTPTVKHTCYPGDGTSYTASTYSSQDITYALDNDLSNVFNFSVVDGSGATPTQILTEIKLNADFTLAGEEDIHLGLTLDSHVNSLTADSRGVAYELRVDLLDGSTLYWSSSGWSRIKTVKADGSSNHATLRSAPFGDRVSPATTGETSNASFTYTFDSSDFDAWKLDLEPTAYKDIDSIYFRIFAWTTNSSNYTCNFTHTLRNLGFYTTEPVDDLTEIYIDSTGTLSDSSIIGANDKIAKDILVNVLGNTVADGFAYSDYAHNHLTAYVGDNTTDVLETLAREGVFVIGSREKGNIYSTELVLSQDETDISLTLPSTEIIRVETPLEDVTLDEFMNLPTITFTDSNGETESVEVISLDEFPTHAAIQADSKNYAQVFSFSTNFLSRLVEAESEGAAFSLLNTLWTICKNSYTKNAIQRQGDISISTYTIESIITDQNAQALFLLQLRLNTQRRKRVKVVLDCVYGIDTVLKLGSRVKIYHPDLMQNQSLYGFLDSYSINLKEAETTIELIVDSFKDGNGNVDFF